MHRSRHGHAIALAMATAMFSAFLPTSPSFAHGGEDHGDTPAPVESKESGLISISGFGEALELTIVHGPFDAGETVALSMFLANLDTNRPVSNASLALTLTGPNTEIAIEPRPDPESPGEYSAEVVINADGSYTFFVEAETEDDFDLFSVDGFAPSSIEEEIIMEEESSFWSDNLPFFVLGGFVIVALGSYSLGSRERSRKIETMTPTEADEKATQSS